MGAMGPWALSLGVSELQSPVCGHMATEGTLGRERPPGPFYELSHTARTHTRLWRGLWRLARTQIPSLSCAWARPFPPTGSLLGGSFSQSRKQLSVRAQSRGTALLWPRRLRMTLPLGGISLSPAPPEPQTTSNYPTDFWAPDWYWLPMRVGWCSTGPGSQDRPSRLTAWAGKGQTFFFEAA